MIRMIAPNCIFLTPSQDGAVFADDKQKRRQRYLRILVVACWWMLIIMMWKPKILFFISAAKMHFVRLTLSGDTLSHNLSRHLETTKRTKRVILPLLSLTTTINSSPQWLQEKSLCCSFFTPPRVWVVVVPQGFFSSSLSSSFYIFLITAFGEKDK